MRYFKKMVGERLYLSPINPDDFETYTMWLNDLETALPLGPASHHMISLSSEKELLENLSKKEHMFAIVRSDDGDDRVIGNCGFNEIDLIYRRGTIGIFIGDPESRGKGYGTEALRLLLEYGFGILNLENVMLTVFSFNKRAIASYEKVGFKTFGTRRRAMFVNAQAYDVVYMDILRDEFDRDVRSRLPVYFEGF